MTVHHLRQAGVNPDGEVEDGMPTSLPDAWDVIRTMERKFRAACGQITRLQNELEGQRTREIEAKTIMEVLIHWRDVVGKDSSKVQLVAGGKRWERIRQRMHDKLEGREPWTVDELKLVPVGALESDWHAGRDPKTKGKKYLEVETIYRDAEQVEKFVQLAHSARDRDLDARVDAHLQEHMPEFAQSVRWAVEVEQLAVLDPTVFLPDPDVVRAEADAFEQRPAMEGEAA